MKLYYRIVTLIAFLFAFIIAFKLIQIYGHKPELIKETYNSFNGGYTCFDGQLGVPLPGKSKCFDCEREMIARNGCNIAAGAKGNPTLSFAAARDAEQIWGTPQYGMPSRMYTADIELIGRTPQCLF